MFLMPVYGGKDKYAVGKTYYQMHTDYYNEVGRKYGLERGDDIAMLPGEERRERVHKSKDVLEAERQAKEAIIKSQMEHERLEGQKEKMAGEVQDMKRQKESLEEQNDKLESAIQNKEQHKEKLEGLRDLVESTEDRLIIFYNFTAELEAMQKKLADLNRPYSVVNGSKKDLTAYDRADDSITFIQYQAGAMGGNYQKANKIIYFTLPLGKGSCDMWEQSKKRIHRIGQAKPCFYYYLLVKGTVEERNLAALKEGKELTDELFKNT